MSRILFVVLACLILRVSGGKPVIKGKQYVRQTTTARLVGGVIPQEIMDMLNSNSSIRVVSPVPMPPLGGTPVLITEEVKTVVTRMSIPLNSSTSDNERYIAMLKKFIINNKINLGEPVDDVENFQNNVMGIKEIEERLQLAAILQDNLETVLRDVLVNHWAQMPKGSHAPLSHIYRLLQLRRIPIIDLVERAEVLSSLNNQEQWVTVFIELHKHIPPYMRSCVTYLLENLQTGSLIMNDVLTDFLSDPYTPPKLVKNLNLQKTTPLIFPTELIHQIPQSHIEELGETTAALLTTVREHGKMTPKLLRLFIKTVPRNTLTSEAEQIFYSQINEIEPTEAENKIVTKASRKAFEKFTEKLPSEIFQTILTQVAANAEDYKTMLTFFQVPRENYIVS